MFVCAHCGEKVSENAPGTHNRNHCPFCLYSLHVDNEIGDRSSVCGGLMCPIGKMLKKDGEEVMVHKCEKCGLIRKNRVAGDDNVKKVDNLDVLL
jgi:ribosome biogenesis GTPase / thiamine phosphate phosphatase